MSTVFPMICKRLFWTKGTRRCLVLNDGKLHSPVNIDSELYAPKCFSLNPSYFSKALIFVGSFKHQHKSADFNMTLLLVESKKQKNSLVRVIKFSWQRPGDIKFHMSSLVFRLWSTAEILLPASTAPLCFSELLSHLLSKGPVCRCARLGRRRFYQSRFTLVHDPVQWHFCYCLPFPTCNYPSITLFITPQSTAEPVIRYLIPFPSRHLLAWKLSRAASTAIGLEG